VPGRLQNRFDRDQFLLWSVFQKRFNMKQQSISKTTICRKTSVKIRAGGQKRQISPEIDKSSQLFSQLSLQ
jgi:hypothetical protein